MSTFYDEEKAGRLHPDEKDVNVDVGSAQGSTEVVNEVPEPQGGMWLGSYPGSQAGYRVSGYPSQVARGEGPSKMAQPGSHGSAVEWWYHELVLHVDRFPWSYLGSHTWSEHLHHHLWYPLGSQCCWLVCYSRSRNRSSINVHHSLQFRLVPYQAYCCPQHHLPSWLEFRSRSYCCI